MTRQSTAGLIAIAGLLACGAPQASTHPSPTPAQAAIGAKPDSSRRAAKPKIKPLKFKNRIVRFLSIDEQERLLAAYAPHVQPIAIVLW